MAHFSSGESSKPCSPQKAALIEDLKNVRQSNAQYLEVLSQMETRLRILEVQRMEKRLSKLELKYERSSHSNHARHHHHEERRQHVAGPCSPNVQLPTFS